ncbi:MAG: hypothetical protein CFE28_16265 [Alphaproteobacteria bacterium PA2]|nr:MAG: hypothetical protein CFE28_16265 [Alphaproteobacteria bacterium PA2]
MDDLAHRGQTFPVNGRDVEFPDRVVTGREVLTKSGNVPASEFQLILAHEGRTHLIGTDDDIDLKAQAGGFLRAFPSDRSFSFTIDEVGQVWGEQDMEVDEFLTIWPASNNHDWVLEREDEPDVVLSPGGLLSFGPGGVEHVVSRRADHAQKVLVTVVTTAGTFPAEGFKRYPASALISEILADAKRKLKITDTDTWIVTVGGTDVDVNLTLAQACLAGEVVLEWGAREGGGGA